MWEYKDMKMVKDSALNHIVYLGLVEARLPDSPLGSPRPILPGLPNGQKYPQ